MEISYFSALCDTAEKQATDAWVMWRTCSHSVLWQAYVLYAWVQYQILMEFIESLERLALADKFRKYHPAVPRKGHTKEWLISVL